MNKVKRKVPDFITKKWTITKESEEKIIEDFTNGMSIKDICNNLKIYRKAVEKLLLSKKLITQDECKYF